MSEKRFSVIKTNTGNFVFDSEKLLTSYQVADLLNSLCEENEQLREQCSYWKHRVNSLLWILSQFDKDKVKELLKEIENE